MSDTPRHCAYILRDIAEAAERYLAVLEELLPGRPSMVRHQTEFRLAERAHTLQALFRELDACFEFYSLAPDIGLQRTLKKIRTSLDAQLNRWGWGFLRHERGMTYMTGRRAHHRQRKEIPFYRANLAWRLFDEVEEDSVADKDANYARALGLQPDPEVTPENAERIVAERLDRLNADSLSVPELGEAIPEVTNQEFVGLACHVESLKRTTDRMLMPDEADRWQEEGDAARRDYLRRHPEMNDDGEAVEPESPATPPAVEPEPEPSPAPAPKQRKRRGGRPKDTDPKQDARIVQAWSTGEHRTYADLEHDFKLERGEAERALDRHRKRENPDG